MGKSRYYTTSDKAEQHEALNPLLVAMYKEFQDLSKKKHDGVVNKGKIAIGNRLLKDILNILKDEPNRPYLDLLEEDSLPQNSDVALILSQYCAAMSQFQEKHYGWNSALQTESWFIKK